ncbi:hypothetical protein ACH37Y_06375 [Sphingomonas paucimobilis]|uniref:hypothetical protein n=1 Tax=Sphingomonas TaxID=13687 RepID=UPI000DE569EC|nr:MULTISPECIES: hypothetical protein [Sphingomonas]MCM3679479.1 hypothetical protein [Sphingomonas paucimobilis]QBE91492.1 hypothetical protein DRN02_005235 [Sphingomonas paucimobilis]RSU66620.1 hypothetical protein BRX36_07970 [Sphingomonas sp. S-NIH.Pt1_0416]
MRSTILGRIDARRDDYELAKYAGWKAIWFHRQERLEPFGDYAVKEQAGTDGERQRPEEMLASLISKAGSGAPINVELVDRPRPLG